MTYSNHFLRIIVGVLMALWLVSEFGRIIAVDDLAEGKVGLDFSGNSVSVAIEHLANYKPVQLGLSVATILPVSSVQRGARAARRTGMNGSEGSLRRLALNFLSCT